jgi:hypothetical protein
MLPLETLIICALAVSAISTTATKALIFKQLRDKIPFKEGDENKPTLFMLFHCPYCFSHWVSFGLVLVMGWAGTINFIINSFAIVAVANAWTWILLTSMTRMEKRS